MEKSRAGLRSLLPRGSMSLRRKIVLGFFISASAIAILAVTEYVNIFEIRKQIRYLEYTDSIRSKSLQIRRHEKNFFLYPSSKKQESAAVHGYLNDLQFDLETVPGSPKDDTLRRLRGEVTKYGARFGMIESNLDSLLADLASRHVREGECEQILPVIESVFYSHPPEGRRILQESFGFAADDSVVRALDVLAKDVNALRLFGENIIDISRDLDRTARDNVEGVLRLSQTAMAVLLPLFFISGISALFLISRSIVRRLRLLIELTEYTGMGHFSQVVIPSPRWMEDEVGLLIGKFNEMAAQLSRRDEDLRQKNRELLQSKKLTAIGTLAAGVAHELNNPLNNIFVAAQTLRREVGEDCPPIMRDTIEDISSQTRRVKSIIGGLLDYARGRDPQFRPTGLRGLVEGVIENLSKARDLGGVRFGITCDPEGVSAPVDPQQMEQVFVNLFTNSLEAMEWEGELSVCISAGEQDVEITVTDTGKGMAREDAEKVFEPFFTTKDKGTGLGMAIVFNIIQKHRGTIVLTSRPGAGTRCAITLPLRQE